MNKIVFFDLDGTLLNEKKRVLSESKEAIKNARESGMEVVICSGRQQAQVRHYQEEAGAGRYIITTNGAEIYDTQTEEQLYHCSLEKEFCKKLHEYIIQNDLFFRIDTKYGRYFNQEEYRMMNEILFEEEPNQFYDENDVLQISVGDTNSSKIDDLVKILNRITDVKIENRYTVRMGQKDLNIINIINKNASKGNAIRGLCKYLKISLEEAVAFGDDNNDVSMFEAVGHPVAMGNAFDKLKLMAKEVTLINDEPGISKVLNRLVEENKEL